MITKQELMDFSREFSLEANTVEKDYVLAWILAGIANHPSLFDKWIFKGGTCLKKCYFETYRFSEDLDFTLIDENHIGEQFLIDSFKQIVPWIYDAAGIEIPANTAGFEVYKNNAGKIAVEGKIGYIGPLQRRNNPARIKLDLTADEILVSQPALRTVHHPYSDNPQNGIKVHCYSFPEIFAEKIRALSERARPRDLYDVIHLYRHVHSGIKPMTVLAILKKKCEYKTIPLPSMKQLENHPKLQELETEWENMLAHQLPMLPPLEQFWQELPNLFEWLHGRDKQIKLEQISPPREKVDSTWHPPSMIQSWRMKSPLELIRYAGANHLCLEVFYENSSRIVEPYDLKRTQEGNLLLVAIRHDTGEWRSYRIDRIQGMEVTRISFAPRYLITLTPFSGF